MAKTKAPLFSLDATGTLDKNITYKGKKQSNIAQKYSKPGAVNPFESSPRQKDQRSIIRLITIHWQCMSSSEKLSWEVAAKDKRFKGSGYHYFLHMAQQNLTQYLGLVGYWSMNYNIDDKIPDLSGNDNDGILSPIYPCDCPTLVDSFDKKYGKALSLDGLDDYLVTTSISNLPTTEVSILVWQNAFQYKTQSTIQLFPDNVSDRINTHCPWDTNKVFWDFGDTTAGGRLVYVPPTDIINSWQHFAFLASQLNNSMKIYRNGILEASKIGMSPYSGIPSAFGIGENVLSSFFFGLIDEVLLWNRALSQEEIKRIIGK